MLCINLYVLCKVSFLLRGNDSYVLNENNDAFSLTTQLGRRDDKTRLS